MARALISNGRGVRQWFWPSIRWTFETNHRLVGPPDRDPDWGSLDKNGRLFPIGRSVMIGDTATRTGNRRTELINEVPSLYFLLRTAANTTPIRTLLLCTGAASAIPRLYQYTHFNIFHLWWKCTAGAKRAGRRNSDSSTSIRSAPILPPYLTGQDPLS